MANSRLNKQDEEESEKFKPDYIAYVEIRTEKHDFAIAEVKPRVLGQKSLHRI